MAERRHRKQGIENFGRCKPINDIAPSASVLHRRIGYGSHTGRNWTDKSGKGRKLIFKSRSWRSKLVSIQQEFFFVFSRFYYNPRVSSLRILVLSFPQASSSFFIFLLLLHQIFKIFLIACRGFVVPPRVRAFHTFRSPFLLVADPKHLGRCRGSTQSTERILARPKVE